MRIMMVKITLSTLPVLAADSNLLLIYLLNFFCFFLCDLHIHNLLLSGWAHGERLMLLSLPGWCCVGWYITGVVTDLNILKVGSSLDFFHI